jgi:hypothetical protein
VEKKKVVLTLVGIALLGAFWSWALWPEAKVTVTFQKEIEKIAAEKGIPVTEVKRLEVKFVEGVGLGGAGGLGAPIVTPKDPQQFFELCGKEAKILVANEKDEFGNKAIRKYWALVPSETQVIEYTEVYRSPKLDFGVSAITQEGVVFEKEHGGLVLLAAILTIFVGILRLQL